MIEFISQTLPLTGEIKVQGDKDISYFSLILSSLALGKSTIKGLLESENVLNLIKILKQFGVSIEKQDIDVWNVDGKGINSLKEPINIVDIKYSEEILFLLVGLLSSYDFKLFFAGDDTKADLNLSELFRIFKDINIKFFARKEENIPFLMIGNSNKKSLEISVNKYNSIMKNVFLLSCLNNSKSNTIIEKEKSKNHLEIMIKYFGIDFEEHEVGNRGNLSTKIGKEIIIKNQNDFLAKDINIPSDISFSAFITSLALLIPGSKITLKNLLMNQYRDAFYRTLIDMGADITFINQKIVCGEKVCDIVVNYSKINDIIIPANRIYKMLYEYPILMFIASISGCNLKIQGLDILKQDDNDTFSSILNLLKEVGLNVVEKDNSIEISGKFSGNNVKINTKNINDSKVLFLAGMYGLFGKESVKINNSIEKDFPNLKEFLKNIGVNIK